MAKLSPAPIRTSTGRDQTQIFSPEWQRWFADLQGKLNQDVLHTDGSTRMKASLYFESNTHGIAFGPGTTGDWVIIVSGNSLLFQRFEGGVYVTKGYFTA